MQMHEKYDSEDEARTAAKRGYEMARSRYNKDDCQMYAAGRTIIVVHPDLMRGTVKLRYEW